MRIHPGRFSRFVLAVAALLAPGSPAAAVSPSTWFEDATLAANGTPVSTSAGVVLDKNAAVPVNGAWAPLGRVPLVPGQGVTLRARLTFDVPPAAKSQAQFRVALLGPPPGGADTGAVDTLRGWVVLGGAQDNEWTTELWERSHETPFPCASRGTRSLGKSLSPLASPPGTGMRLVITVTKRGPALFDVSGFWGTASFSFNGIRATHDYEAITAVGLLNGKGTGVNRITVDRVEVLNP